MWNGPLLQNVMVFPQLLTIANLNKIDYYIFNNYIMVFYIVNLDV